MRLGVGFLLMGACSGATPKDTDPPNWVGTTVGLPVGTAGTGCFAAGTAVQTPAGPRPIEALKVGDVVLAPGARSRKTRVERIEAVFHHEDRPTWRLVADDFVVDGVTAEHPFWSPTRDDWVALGELSVGDLVVGRGPRGELREVAVDALEPTGRIEDVYNLTVGGTHTYWADDLLVHNKSPVGLQVGTLTMDLAFGWDGAAVIPVQGPGGEQPPVFRMNFGPPNWDGNTAVDPQPDNWCFVEWDLTGTQAVQGTGTPTEVLRLEGLGTGVSNCGQESRPGAGDLVTLREPEFFGGDPVAAYGDGPWQFVDLGGDLDPQLASFPTYLEPYGYVAENFWGGSLANDDLFGPGVTVSSVVYGSQIDATGQLVLDGNNEPVRWTRADQGPGALQPGYYVHALPWIFTFQ